MSWNPPSKYRLPPLFLPWWDPEENMGKNNLGSEKSESQILQTIQNTEEGQKLRGHILIHSGLINKNFRFP